MSEGSGKGRSAPVLNLDPYPRILGLLLLLLGLICGLVAFYFPLRELLQGATKITLFSKAVWAFLLFTLLGLIFIIFGPIPARLALQYAALRGWQKWLVIILLIILFGAAGILLPKAITEYLRQFGYEINFQ